MPGPSGRQLPGASAARAGSVAVYRTIANRAGQAWFALSQPLSYPDVRVYYRAWVE